MKIAAALERTAVPVLVIALLVLLAYANSLPNGFAFDDAPLLVDNTAVQGFSAGNLRRVLVPGPGALEYLPVRDLTYMLEYALWGLNAPGYHLANLVYYLLCCLALFFFVRECAARAAPRPGALALLAAALFALHPIHVEAVAGISQRKYLLAALFLFLALHCYARFRRGGGRGLYALSLLFAAAALLSHGGVLVLPVLILMVEFLPGRPEGDRAWKGITRSLPYFLIVLAVTVINYQVMREAGTFDSGAGTAAATRGEFAVRVFFLYLRMLVFPFPLSIRHFFNHRHVLFEVGTAFFIAGIAALPLLAYLLRRRSFLLSFALLWIPLTILPGLGFAASHLPAERYLFLPSAGVCLMLALLFDRALSRGLPAARYAGAAVLAAVLMLSTTVIVRQNRVWKDNITLYTDGVEKSPGDVEMGIMLAREYFDRGDYPRAFDLLAQIKKAAPYLVDYEFFQALYAYKRGDDRGALAALDRLRAIIHMDLFDVHVLYGKIHLRLGNRDLAREHFQRALRSATTLPTHYFSKLDVKSALQRLGAS